MTSASKLVFFPAYLAGGTSRVNARHVQGFTGVDVADADDDMAVHDELLDRHLAAT